MIKEALSSFFARITTSPDLARKIGPHSELLAHIKKAGGIPSVDYLAYKMGRTPSEVKRFLDALV